jgi:hypothetical protein
MTARKTRRVVRRKRKILIELTPAQIRKIQGGADGLAGGDAVSLGLTRSNG